uniref:Plant-specific domain TIGR01615 family protein n=1 Tax=Kalanchoe fedtschenkoi TaxID=63787 RepID=A0A7N0UCI8_KALFE
MDCGVCSPAEDMWRVMAGGQIGSHESEHDLAVMVSDFMENGSGGADSWCSSDSDSGFSDLAHLADTISYCRHSTDQYERSLISLVQSLLLSINLADLEAIPSADCNACCIRFSLVTLLRLSGYDAAVCSTKWQGRGKVPGGDHEYIDITRTERGNTDRFIIDIDFRSHFEIARAIDSYDKIRNTLPVVYAGSLAKLEQYLPIMVEAARTSLKQNSMPLPPWRSLAYLQAKWRSPYQRKFTPEEHDLNSNIILSDHKRCCGHLKRLQSLLQSEIEAERTSKHKNCDTRKLKLDWGRHSSFRTF